MHVTPISDELIEQWGNGARRLVMAPPQGHEFTGDIRPVEMLVEMTTVDGMVMPTYRARFILDPGDLDALMAGQAIWLTQLSHVVPFDLQVG